MRRTLERRTAMVVEEPPPGDVLTLADVKEAVAKRALAVSEDEKEGGTR